MRNVFHSFLAIVSLFFFCIGGNVTASQFLNSEDELVIYTYDSLLNDPGYDFIGNFSKFAGIDRDKVKLVRLSDAGLIVTQAALEKNSPVADVLVGIDNVLVHKARKLNILEPYKPAGSEEISDSLINDLADDFLLTPYDYGVISLWLDKTRINVTSSNFTLEDLKSKDYNSKLIIQDPQLSSPGLGFLLWSLAEFGHDSLEFGSQSAWEDFWLSLNQDTRLVSSWNDALTLFYTPEASRSMMVSYTSSPAYGNCLYNDNSTEALLSVDENGKPTGWRQIEGIGLVKNAQHPTLAKRFIDWFISEQLQNQIYMNQWVYPAHNSIEVPECYKNSTFLPEEIVYLNEKISSQQINQYLNSWLDDWVKVWASMSQASFQQISLVYLTPTVVLFIFVCLIRTKKRKLK